MRAYRVSVNLKLGLIAFALLIAFASLAYTQRLVRQLGEREQFIIQLWAAAQKRVADASLHVNPYISELDRLDSLVAGSGSPGPRSEEHTSELQSRGHLVCRLLLEKKKKAEQRKRYKEHT